MTRARRVVVAPIRLYQRVVVAALPRRCRYEPSCSRYAAKAIEEFGILRGLVLAAWRLLRCNPFSHGASTRSRRSACSGRAPRASHLSRRPCRSPTSSSR